MEPAQEVPAMTSSVAELPRITGTCPELLTAVVRRAVRSGGSWPETADRVVAALRASHGIWLPGPGLLSPEQLAGDPSGYQTHLVHAEPDGSFSIVVMVWLPGQRTPVHDHLTWCVTAVLRGTEYEEVYRLIPGEATPLTPRDAPDATNPRAARAPGDGHLQPVARNANPAGTVSGFAPPGDIHQVTNIGDTIAVSMHVYGTDITRVGSSVRRVYDLPIR
jgi:predicted metal-dependent enzyme (double-stranded beta helix superfamily)